MAKHEFGTVRVIPADPMHYFHQVNRYHVTDPVGAQFQRPARRPQNATAIVKSVVEFHEPGRHRLEGREHSANAVYFQHPYGESPYGESPYPSHVNKWECPRRWVDGIAVEFEYL